MTEVIITRKEQLMSEARRLQDFFLGTYAEDTLEAAIKSKDLELLELAVKEMSSQRQLIEEQEDEATN